jgi:hypothetical protein
MKSISILLILFFTISCSEQSQEKKGPKPFISMGSNNNSETSIEIEEIILDRKWYGIGTGTHECGTSINGGGRGGPLWNIPIPRQTIYVKWYSWKYQKNIEATVELPPKKTLTKLYYNPPWFDANKQRRPESTIIIDIRPNNRVWVKLSKDLYPQSQEDIMIIGEAKGAPTDEVVTRYRHYKEGKDYRLDCKEKREKRKAESYGSLYRANRSSG